MGIFSSKTEIVVGTSVSRLVDDTILPDSQTKGVISAILKGGDIPPYVLDELTQNIGARAERMYSYAGRDYPFGLPTGEFLSANTGRTEINQVLNTLEGATVTIEYSSIGPPNILHIGWLKLIRDHGYNSATNLLGALSTSKGKNVYLDKMEVVVPTALAGSYAAGTLSQWGMSTSTGYSPTRPALGFAPALGSFAAAMPVIESSTATEDLARVTAAWETGGVGSTVSTETFDITNSEYPENRDYIHVKYTVGGLTKYWIYRIGEGTYPELDSLFDTPTEVSGEFFPMVHFRNQHAKIDPTLAPDDYKASVKISKYLGIDYDYMVEQIEANPDIASLEQAYLIFGVPPDTTNPLEQRYLFEFFSRLFDSNKGKVGAVTTTDPAIEEALFSEQRPENGVTIKDSKVTVSLVNSGIYRRRKVGSIGPVGTHTSTSGVVNRDLSASAGFRLVRPIMSHTYRKQISTSIYEEVEVLGLSMRYQVFNEYWTSSDDNGEVLLVPLDRSITRDFRIQDREVLYARSLHFVFNSLQVITIKWYQRAGWAFLMKFAAVVMLIVSVGTAVNEAMAVWAASSTVSAAAWAAFTVLVESVVAAVVVAKVFTAFVKAVGIDLAVILAVIAAVTGAYQIIESGSFKAVIPSAKALLQVATGLIKGAASTVQDLLQDLGKEYSAFEKEMKDQLTLLEDANKLLQPTSLLEPFTIFGEEPQEYYRRTIHAGNVGTIGFDVLHSYVDTALTLPTITDTLGGQLDGRDF